MLPPLRRHADTPPPRYFFRLRLLFRFDYATRCRNAYAASMMMLSMPPPFRCHYADYAAARRLRRTADTRRRFICRAMIMLMTPCHLPPLRAD